MHSLVLISLAAAAIRIINAQDLSALPACARDAASAGFAQSGCGLSDIKCICNASAFLTSVQSLIVQQCNVPDQQATIAFAVELCQNAGVVLPSALESPTLNSTPTPTTTMKAVSAEAESVSSSGNNAITVVGSRSALNVDSSSSVSNLVSTLGRSTSPVSSTSSSSSSFPSISTASYTSSLSSLLRTSSISTSIASPTSTISLPSSNSTGNTTVATSNPVPFKGDAAGTSQSLLGLCVAIAGTAFVGWTL